MRLLLLVAMLTVQCSLFVVLAQEANIKIAGSVYGGGNAGNTGGNTHVTVRAGEIDAVFGGARMADVKGSTTVYIDGEKASSDILVANVYGGNDISGTIGQSTTNAAADSWDAVIRTSPCNEKITATVDGVQVKADKTMLVVGSLYGGGNGDYIYKDANGNDLKDNAGNYIVKDDADQTVATSKSPFNKPELGKAYLDLKGGNIAHVYGGGNNATVTQNTSINIDDTSDNLQKAVTVWAEVNKAMLEARGQTIKDVFAYLQMKVKLSTFQSNLSSFAFNFARVFGGNNKAEMNIRPTWNLKNGIIRDLYSGGNQGAMTSPEGLLLNIEEGSNIVVENLYGGCRMADVCPMVNGVYTPVERVTIGGLVYPEEFAARVVVRGGDINNVYGGNDISGKVYGGNAVGIRTSVRGDVYGGGNGSYAYTDNAKLGQIEMYKDFYYDPGSNSVEALNAHRPNAEQVSIHVMGTETKPTIVHGGIFCGGNNATIMSTKDKPKVELKIGSYVYADSVFLGNNGANMVSDEILNRYTSKVTVGESDEKYSSMVLTDAGVFETYMDGAAMRLMPSVTFDSKAKGDLDDYKEYTSYFGSFFCGGNVGSMRVPGKTKIDFDKPVIVYNKVVGGCNNANIYKSAHNAEFLGGLLEAPESDTGNKLELNFNGLKIQPMRWNESRTALEWNTYVDNVKNTATASYTGEAEADDIKRRFKGGNIYGGCYNNGHVNGNVVININETLMERDKLFDETDEGEKNYANVEKGVYKIKTRRSGVILSEQGTDVFGAALNVFGGGYGGDSEIWGSATINLNKGYTFQIFGGGEMGAIGKAVSSEPIPNSTAHKLTYKYNKDYSTYVNLNGDKRYPGVARGATGDHADMAECEYIYGGAFEGVIAGDSHVNLNNGRIFNSFGGSCNADILGHVETYVGSNGFPYVRDYVYGGNDLGGKIEGSADLSGRISNDVASMVYSASQEQVKHVPSYVEYIQGRVEYLLGGGSGNYDYKNTAYAVGEGKRVTSKPYQHNTFVNFRPNTNANNEVMKVFGAGEGYPGDRDGDQLQDHSYVLIDIPANVTNFSNTEVFGAGAYNGLGMGVEPDKSFDDVDEVSAIIDLMRGQVGAAYGGSYEEGITRRTVVNVPSGSSIKINRIFGGAYGTQILPPCDVYESNVNYRTTNKDARVTGAIYGGNNNERRTLYAHVNISSPVLNPTHKSGLGTVYGAGRGIDTWSEYTEVNLENGAKVNEVYGGGEMGHVLNGESVMRYMNMYKDNPSPQISKDDPNWKDPDRWTGEVGSSALKDEWIDKWKQDWINAWTFGKYYECRGVYTAYSGNSYMNLNNEHVVRKYDELDNGTANLLAGTGKKYNANVIIHEGATVGNYAYGGGYGDVSKSLSGDVYGTTYVALLGGTVEKDVYAAGTAGGVYDLFGVNPTNDPSKFVASANAYIKGGMARNVSGGGWRGSVGYHNGLISDVANNASDILGETHVVIGDLDGTSFTNGIPAINRNVYGGGEGGGIFGTAYVTINNGRIGYRYKNVAGTRATDNYQYVEELDDAKPGDNQLDRSGNVFGGGYVANSYVDISRVNMYGGIVRGGLYGGGEVGPIGRGTVNPDKPKPEGTFINGDAKIYKGGETHVALYKGHVLRDVFGGGRGFDNWGGNGYMTAAEQTTMDLSSKGYVFGKTDVRILGGEVGTEAGVANGYGNVFGGGNVGYVYSAEGTKSADDGYYYKNGLLTEDCSVVITPYCQVMAGKTVKIDGVKYLAGDYVPATELDKLRNKSADKDIWEKLDIDGIIVRNAVFAGGNVSVGDNSVYANAKTVLGNVSANVVDIYNRDLVTVGTEHVGGLYGDGNLTLVDGYRELNISNYGTDYYGMSESISLDDYYKLTDREKAYFALEYQCKKQHTVTTEFGTKVYDRLDRITEETYNALDDQYKDGTYWELFGFCSIYAGRLMNTIQRADFCGVFGSRLVMQGAKDRVPSVADKTDYTVNRVGEVSLNQVNSIVTGGVDMKHGNYFGIYSVVNCMGALTSDVDFYETTRTTDSESYPADGVKTFYEWKEENAKDRKRNNGKVANSVALASGVYLELTTEKSTPEKKDWGLITGVAQLELINVKTGLGGGYVYAKNEHGVRKDSHNDQTILSSYNKKMDNGSHEKAVTNKIYIYDSTEESPLEVQTSGNFVHNVKQIIDDCYPNSNSYTGQGAAPAHYWFIRGTSYVYDQYITAYTGVSNAYSKTQKIPLNINAASNGKMKLEDVKVNLYAYYYDYNKRIPLQNTDENAEYYSVIVNNDKTFHLNDSITYWDWMQLSEADQHHFVMDTYVTIADCKIGDKTYPEGTVLLPADYEQLKASAPTKVIDGKTVPAAYHVNREEDVDFDFVFRRSNKLDHDLGYVVTYAVDNPDAWNMKEDEPYGSYSPKTTGVYGQRFYNEGEIVDKATYDDYENMGSNRPASTSDRPQAQMRVAYITKEEVKFTDKDKTYNFIAGTPLCKDDYSDEAWASIESKVEPAYVCIGTLEFEGNSANRSLLYGEVLTTERINEVVNLYASANNQTVEVARTEVEKLLSKAYICYKEGYYGGDYFEAGKKYTALKGWSSLSDEDRKNFTFNYDALNLLVDPLYSGQTVLYDGNKDPYTYSSEQPINYQAKYLGDDPLTFSYNGSSRTLHKDDVIDRVIYESIPNEQYHFSPIRVNNRKMYVVNSTFVRGDTPYTAGMVITSETYSYMTSDQQSHVSELAFTQADVDAGATYYFCREGYQIDGNEGHPVTDTRTNTTINKGGNVTRGVVITSDNYKQLTNLQTKFTIQGDAPEEVTTLYVARQSDLFDLQKDRIITVIFSYDYTESDELGLHIEPVSERHIVNIHIHFESGVPDIGTLHTPTTALPGEYVGLFQPTVKPGAYEIMGGGWEIFENEEDAERHRNGVEFNNRTPVYWYQDGQYLAYYAKTYLGKTYSNTVPFTVANYHDLKAVMDDQEHHLYIDHPDVKRASKIYINDYTDAANDEAKSGLDLLKDLYDLTVTPTTYDENGDANKITEGNLAGHRTLNNTGEKGVQNMQNLEVFFHANTAPKVYAGNDWTPIASGDGECYAGTIHGEGYHIDGLTKSFIGHLCGHVYNLGVNGSFTSAGLADSGDGYVENCWVKTTGTPDGSVYAVFGDPTDENAATKQMENCYYTVGGGDYKTADSGHGIARRMTEQQFYNGEVAYNLNGYYLKERYNRQAAEADKIDTYGYVENRYSTKDIDFLYANGEIPDEDDVRKKTDEDGNVYYEPLWPDDYLFFGQSLTYGYEFDGAAEPETLPSHLVKNGDCNSLANDNTSNRIFRTPAYFGSKEMGLFHFNPFAVLAAKSADGKYEAYPGMTAVDFTGYKDKAYSKTLDADGIFFAPIADADMTLVGVANADETRNLLVYSPLPDTDNDNGTVLTNYFVDPVMAEKDDGITPAKYRAVEELDDSDISLIHGHLVYRNEDSFTAASDHVLVDREDFNCPMAYTFGDENRMWYQRLPDNYVNAQASGWEAISLPFSAELVTTPDKGEITHFYEGSTTGHEYWLREFKGGALDSNDDKTFVADFLKPAAYTTDVAGTERKDYTNTFLWDYYYSHDTFKDINQDDYQKTYYAEEHYYSNYPYNGVATPYIIGFPGGRYYEFDLSGSFVPQYTSSNIAALDMQPIIFASEPGISIAVTDDELARASVSEQGYRFIPNYSNLTFKTEGEAYLLNKEAGDAFDKNTAGATVEAFRPYFVGANGSRGGGVDRIIFGNGHSQFHPNEDLNKGAGGTLNIYAKKGYIVVESSLSYTTDVRIVTAAGITVASFPVKAGDTVEVRADFAGMYVAHTLDGKYTKKVAVRK